MTTKDAAGNVYGDWSPVTTNTYLYAPAAAIAPGSESFTSPITVTLSDTAPNIQIYYTTDGTNPIAFGPTVQGYSKPFTISSSTVLNVAAWTYTYNGNNQVVSQWSPVTTATYTLTGAPSVTTGAASNVTTTAATLNGTVTANSGTAQYWFTWGSSSTTLTNATPKTGAITGKTATKVSAALSELTAATTYYYKLNASNATGTTTGDLESFTTP